MALDSRNYGLEYNPPNLQTPTVSPTADVRGLNEAQSAGVGTAVGGALQLGATAIQAGAQARQADETRQEARGLANVARQDTLDAQKVSTTQRKELLRQEKDTFKVQKKQQLMQNRHDKFLREFEKSYKNSAAVNTNMKQLVGYMNQDNQLKDTVFKLWGI